MSVTDLMILQIRNQLRAEPEAGCTSLSLAGNSVTRHGPLLAQNWDNDPGLDPFTIVLTRKPTGNPALMNITQAGLIAYIGFNDAGIGRSNCVVSNRKLELVGIPGCTPGTGLPSTECTSRPSAT